MRKLLLLIPFLAAVVSLNAQSSFSTNDVLAYVAMPLAISDVCAVRGVQTDQVASLASYMDQAQVSPEGFIDVFRYVPVALVFNNGRHPDFVQWVGAEVGRGVIGDALVTSMEGRLRTYGDFSIPRTYRHREPRFYEVAYDPDYVPIRVRRYCESELIDPLALIDMPVAVADVCDLGVPYDRVGRLVVELNLGTVAPWQTVELLRYAPPALLATDYGQPDFVQFVYDQRLGGLNGYPLVRVASRRLSVYDVSPRIDVAPAAYAGRYAYAPTVAQNYAQNYVDPIDPAYLSPVVRTRVASGFARSRAFQATAPPTLAVGSPQVTRLLGNGDTSAVVSNPAQARRELAHSSRAEREAARVAPLAPARFPLATAPPLGRELRGSPNAGVVRGITGAPPQMATHGNAERRAHGAAPMELRTFAPPPEVVRPPSQGGFEARHGRSGSRERVASPRSEVVVPPQAIPSRGRPQVSQPMVTASPAEHGHAHERPQPIAVPAPPVFAQPAPAQHGRGHERPQAIAAPPPPIVSQPAVAPPAEQHGHGHGGPPPQAVVTPAPQVVGNGHGQAGQPAANPQEQKKKGKDH